MHNWGLLIYMTGLYSTQDTARLRCPHCNSLYAYCVSQRGLVDWLVYRIFGRKPHYCERCQTRFYLSQRSLSDP